jgi:hypothetical protein
MTKRGILLVIPIVLLIIIFSNTSKGDVNPEQLNDMNSDLSNGETVSYNGADISGDARINPDGSISGTDFRIGGRSFRSGSNVRIEHGRIVSADRLVDEAGNEVRFGRDIERDSSGVRVGEAEEYRKDNVYAKNIRDADFGDDGTYFLGEVELLSVDGFVVSSGRGVSFDGGVFRVDSADGISIENGFITLVRSFEGDRFGFWVESAEIVMVRCLDVQDVERSWFTVYSGGTQINPSSGVLLNITDCITKESFFVALGEDAEVSIGEEEPITYSVKQGNLSFDGDGFYEAIQVEDNTVVVLDHYGFTCMSISPVGTYFYSDKVNKRKDFSISIPDYGYNYRLCIRKDESQQYSDFDGLVDVVDGFNELSGIVNYLRYPLKDGELAGLVLEDVYQGFAMPVARMFYDSGLVFLNNVSVSIPYSANTTVSLTVPSNYYMIKEEPMEDGIHTLVKVDTSLGKEELTDSIIRNYNGFIIANNVLVKDNLMVLSPGHEMIAEVLG